MIKSLLRLGLFSISAFIILQDGIYYSEILELIHIFIIAISCFSLFSYENRPYSAFKSFHVFYLIFIGIAPIIQYKEGISFWGALPFYEKDYCHSSLVCLIALVIFNIWYAYFATKNKSYLPKLSKYIIRTFHKSKREIRAANLSSLQTFLIISLALIACIARLYQNNFNVMSLMFRGGELKDQIEMTKASGLLISTIFTPMNMCLFLYVWYINKHQYILLCLLFIATLFTASPTGIARFSCAAIYLPVFMSLFAWIRKKHIYVSFLSTGLIILFPLLSTFRDFNKNIILNLKIDTSLFQSVDFDSYSTLTHVLKQDIVTYGNQLLGCILFWFPRSIWTEKPVGSGEFIAGKLHFFFTNISCNILSEGYINFGYIGILAFIVLLAWLFSQLDSIYWTYTKFKSRNYFSVLYFSILGLLFLILRGDLLCSFAYLCGYLFVACSIYFLFNKIFKSKY